MSVLLPSPLLSLLLFAVWLLLNQSLSAGHLVLAALFALTVPIITTRLRGERVPLRAPATALRLFGVFLWDVLASNLAVLRQSLGPESSLRPRFVWVPLDIEDRHGIAILSSMITLTPGTLSADLSDDRRHLLVHALHAEDEQELVATIKSRYERPLMEIFR